MRRGSLGVLLLLAAAGCQETTPVSSGSAVWSDDDGAVLFVVNHGLESPAGYGHVDYERDRWEMFMLDPGLSMRAGVATGEGAVHFPFYFMRSSGYIMARMTGRDGRTRLARLDLDGRRRSVEMSSGAAIPSPDGALVGLVQGSCEEGGDALVRCRRWVDFFDAGTLEGIGRSGDIEYAYDALDLYGRVGIHLMWSPDSGTLYAQEHHAREGVRRTLTLASGEPPRDAELPCIIADHPPTTSSDVAADGRFLRVSSSRSGEPYVEVLPGEGPGYPGRCF